MEKRNNPSNGSFSFKDPFKKPSSGVSVSHSFNVKNLSELISLADIVRNRLSSLLPQFIPNQGLVEGTGTYTSSERERITLDRCDPSHTHT